ESDGGEGVLLDLDGEGAGRGAVGAHDPDAAVWTGDRQVEGDRYFGGGDVRERRRPVERQPTRRHGEVVIEREHQPAGVLVDRVLEAEVRLRRAVRGEAADGDDAARGSRRGAHAIVQ